MLRVMSTRAAKLDRPCLAANHRSLVPCHLPNLAVYVKPDRANTQQITHALILSPLRRTRSLSLSLVKFEVILCKNTFTKNIIRVHQSLARPALFQTPE